MQICKQIQGHWSEYILIETALLNKYAVYTFRNSLISFTDPDQESAKAQHFKYRLAIKAWKPPSISWGFTDGSPLVYKLLRIR